MEKELPKRKPTRLNNFDYSSIGAYFVTICTQDRQPILSEIIKATFSQSEYNDAMQGSSVGEGLAPPEYKVVLKPCGEIVKEQLLALEKRYPCITIEDYVVMPDHIHFILLMHRISGGASPSPTLNEAVCTFKSLTSRICKQKYRIQKIFQRSYADHIIRDRDDYETRIKYIYENPMRWYYKKIHPDIT